MCSYGMYPTVRSFFLTRFRGEKIFSFHRCTAECSNVFPEKGLEEHTYNLLLQAYKPCSTVAIWLFKIELNSGMESYYTYLSIVKPQKESEHITRKRRICMNTMRGGRTFTSIRGRSETMTRHSGKGILVGRFVLGWQIMWASWIDGTCSRTVVPAVERRRQGAHVCRCYG